MAALCRARSEVMIMFKTGLLVFVWLASAALVTPVTVRAEHARQDPAPAPVPDKRPEVASLLEKLDGHIKKEGKEDTEAVAVIDEVNQEFPKSGPKDKTAIVNALSKCFEVRRQVPEGEAPNNKLFMGAAVALGQMGPESTKTLEKWINHKNLRKDLAVRHRLIVSLGKTHDKDAVKPLIGYLDLPEAPLVGAAAEGLTEFDGADLETRKTAFEAMLKNLMSAKGTKDSNINDTVARERYDIIAAPLITGLGKLSKHDERDPDKWQTWWNKNKKADWDKAE